MTTKEVAARFMELATQGKFDAVQDELYSNDCVSIEPTHAQDMQSVEGLAAIKEKGKKFNESVGEVHGGYTNDPIISDNHFAVTMGMDITMKGMSRMKMDEVAVYEVKDGKITKEQFFY